MRASAISGWLVSAVILGGCAPRAAEPSHTPAAAPAPPPEAPAKAQAATQLALPAAPAAVPQAPSLCDRFVIDGSKPASASTCDAAALAHGVSNEDAAARDAALAELEPCSTWPRGVVRALRAELAPAECGDVIVADALEATGESALSPELRQTLVALGLAARLRRLAANPPAPPAAPDKAALEGYFKSTLFPWISEQANAIHDVSVVGASLRGYAQGVVAVEAGMADMRFVEIARGVPIPREMADDAELRNVYYASLDEALEPRKNRGRDAALVGLGQLAQVGVLHSPRLDAARSLLSRVYGAHRIDALDRLMLPPLPALAEKAPAENELARRAPTFYAPFLVPAAAQSPAEPSTAAASTGTPGAGSDELTLFRAFLERGVPAARERDLSSGPKSHESTLLLARARLELGRTYFRAEDFALVERRTRDQKNEDAEFLHALATALLAGPRDAADLIRRGPRFADALGNLEALDGIATGKGRWAGAAAFNAAYLRELVAPAEDAAYWQDLAARYGKAARVLSGPQRKEAEGSAKAAVDTAKALTKH